MATPPKATFFEAIKLTETTEKTDAPYILAQDVDGTIYRINKSSITIETDATPTAGSTKALQSGGAKSYIDAGDAATLTASKSYTDSQFSNINGDRYTKKAQWISIGDTNLTKIGVRLGSAEVKLGTRVQPDNASYVGRIRNVLESATTAGSAAEIYTGADGNLYASYTYGFKIIMDFNFTGAAGAAVSAGIKPAGGAKGNIEPSTSLNVVQLAADSTDANMQIMHNDMTGTCTKIDLGPNWPANFSDDISYRLILTTLPNSRVVAYRAIRYVKKSITGVGVGSIDVLDQFDREVSGVINTNISNSSGASDSVAWSVWACNRSLTTAVRCSLSKIDLEVDW